MRNNSYYENVGFFDNNGIRTIILIPILILGVFTILCCFEAVVNTKRVNENAKEIAGVYMEGTSLLGDIEAETQMIHKNSLAHIVATDLDTMISLVDTITTQESTLDKALEEYER